MKTMNKKGPGIKFQRAFTLVEAMMALAVIAVLSAIAIPTYSGYLDSVDIDTVVTDFAEIDLLMFDYFISNDEYPPDLATINMAKDDPWGNPYQYPRMSDASTGQKRKDHNLVPINTDYDLYSKGPDGASVSPLTAAPSRDDIIRANNGDFIGEASDY